MIILLATLVMVLTINASDIDDSFSEIKITKPFKPYLYSNPLLMEIAGAKIINLENGHRVILGVASTEIKNGSAKDRLRQERVCRVKALAAVVGEEKGIQIAHAEILKENTIVIIDNGKEKVKSVSKYLQVTKSKVEGIANDMPVVGRWKSKDGDIFYLALGIIVDETGKRVAD